MEQFKVIGMDLGDKKHQVCVLDGQGEIVEEGTVINTREALGTFFAQARARVVIETGTHSPWIKRYLSELGHEVIVANARKVKLIWQNTNKNDRNDARILARLGRVDAQLLAEVTHRGATAQADLELLKAREALVKARTGLINHVRGAVKTWGERLPSCSAQAFAKRVGALLPRELAAGLEPVVTAIAELTAQIRGYDAKIEAAIEQRWPQAARVRQVPGVGAITALAWVVVLEDPARFSDGRAVGAFVGLTPRRDQSGASDRQLRISKQGNAMLRRLLVTAAHYVLGPFGPPCRLREWGLKLSERGGRNGKKRAVVATARKLAAVLYRLWVGGQDYDPWYQNNPQQRRAAA